MMSLRVRILFSAAAVALAAACSESSQPSTAPNATGPSFDAANDHSQADQATPAPGEAHAHVHELRGAAGGRAGKVKGGAGTGISYHGGPVLQAATKVVSVYWSASTIYNGGPTPGTYGTGAGDGSLVGYFLSHLGGSSYFNINTTYTDGSKTPINNVVNYTGYWANNTNAPSGTTSVSDASMLAMLQSGFNSGALTYDAGTLYAIFTSGQVNLGGGFGTQYCAYHWYGNVSIGGVSKRVLYAAMPYTYAYRSACTEGTPSPNGDAAADAELNVLAHEVEETTTDMYGTAWYDNRGYENADKCAWNFGTTFTTSNGGVANVVIGGRNFLVQQNWVNAGSGGCRQSW
jgi:hypothetical protein